MLLSQSFPGVVMEPETQDKRHHCALAPTPRWLVFLFPPLAEGRSTSVVLARRWGGGSRPFQEDVVVAQLEGSEPTGRTETANPPNKTNRFGASRRTLGSLFKVVSGSSRRQC